MRSPGPKTVLHLKRNGFFLIVSIYLEKINLFMFQWVNVGPSLRIQSPKDMFIARRTRTRMRLDEDNLAPMDVRMYATCRTVA